MTDRVAAILGLLLQGEPPAATARVLGVTRQAVRNVAARYGLLCGRGLRRWRWQRRTLPQLPRVPGERGRPRVDPDAVGILLAAGLGTPEIALQVGAGPSTVRRVAARRRRTP